MTGAGIAINAGILGLGAFVVTWGAAALFAGGLAAYLAHRHLKGRQDFGPAPPLAASGVVR